MTHTVKIVKVNESSFALYVDGKCVNVCFKSNISAYKYYWNMFA